MLISEFSQRVNLTTDAVRFYTRMGLLKPKRNGKGGSRPYQVFAEQDIETVGLIRVLQMLGYSLRDIAGLLDKYATGSLTPQRITEVLNEQLCKVRAQRDFLDRTAAYLSAKLKWIKTGKGSRPKFEDYAANEPMRSSTLQGANIKPRTRRA